MRFRHINSGKLLTVKPLNQLQVPDNQSARGSKRSSKQAKGSNKNTVMNENNKLVLTLGSNIQAEEVDRRIEGIERMVADNKLNLEFNPNTNIEIKKLNKSVALDQIFEIENTIIEPIPRIKYLSVVKIKNLMYNHFISTEIKKIEGETEEMENEEEKKS